MKDEKSDLFKMTFNNGEEGLFQAMSSAERVCLEQGVEPNKIFLINLCMEELVTNALRYGAEGKPTVHFSISLQHDQNGLSLQIADDANPFNPLTEAPLPDLDTNIEQRKLGGLGIHLLKNMTASMTYEYRNNQNIIFITI